VYIGEGFYGQQEKERISNFFSCRPVVSLRKNWTYEGGRRALGLALMRPAHSVASGRDYEGVYGGVYVLD
jgi:hypothetical protein